MFNRYEAIKAERNALAAEIRQRGIRRREFERFITTLEKLPDQVTDFDEALWGGLVEYLTVYARDDLRFMLRDHGVISEWQRRSNEAED